MGIVVDPGIHESIEPVKSPLKWQEPVQLTQVPFTENPIYITCFMQQLGKKDLPDIQAQDPFRGSAVFIMIINMPVINPVVADILVDPVPLGISPGQHPAT